MAFVHSPRPWQVVLFVIFSGAQSIAGAVAETKSVTGERRTFAVIKTEAQDPMDISLPAPRSTWKSPGRTYYYVDSRGGDDTNDGLSEIRPWRSLHRINAGEFAAGDKILLRAGSRWRGFLSPRGSGAGGQPIVIDQYGRGSKPRINAEASWLATVFLSNSEYIEVRNLDVANAGSVSRPKLKGVQVSENDFGTAHHIVLKDLYIHDVNGSNDKQIGGSGIYCDCGGNKVKSRFDGLLIEHCHLVHTDRNGITMDGNWQRDHWYPSLHVVIRGNLLEDIGGDGIVPLACNGALVEYNVVRGGRMRAEDYAAGIWPWSCDHTVVQYNEVSGMKGTRDGEGYDSDYNCRGTLFQYNFSHNNDGGFMLICNNGDLRKPKSIGNINTIIRYNISVNDRLHTFNITGPCQNTLICNNVLYVGKKQVVNAISSGNWGNAWPDDTRFINNLFYVDKGGSARFELGGMTTVVFDHNAFWGQFKSRPADVHAVISNPRLIAPGSRRSQGYVSGPGSPCLNAGVPVFDRRVHDFRGRLRKADAAPSIGAFQTP
jgi:hypothetical protein